MLDRLKAPKRIDAPPADAAAGGGGGGAGSAWNRTGVTWEDKDVSPWANLGESRRISANLGESHPLGRLQVGERRAAAEGGRRGCLAGRRRAAAARVARLRPRGAGVQGGVVRGVGDSRVLSGNLG